ncbi:MAG: ABC transporter substrate-binding protein [Janthinobacterium lividum]
MKRFCQLMFSLMVIIFWDKSHAASDTLLIALTGPFSGGSSDIGISMRNGAKLVIREVNDQGGLDIDGKKYHIEVLELDDEGKNETGASIAQKLCQIPSLNAVIGTANTGVAVAGDHFYQNAKIIRILTPATGTAAMAQWHQDTISDLYIFRFAANDLIQVTMLLEEAIQKMGLKRLALIHDVTNYGISGRDDILKQIKNYPGVELVLIERFNTGDKDMKFQIQKIKESKAQVLIVWGGGPEAAAIANEMHHIGLHIPLMGGWTLSMASYLDNAGAHAEGTFMPQTFMGQNQSKQAGDFVNRYYDTYKVDHIPSPMSAAEGYDAIKILMAAFQQAKSLDSLQVKNALENLEKPISGVITTWIKPYDKWNPKNPISHEAFRPQEVVMAVVKDKKIVFVYDEDRTQLSRTRD